MARVAADVARDRPQSLDRLRVAHVIDQSPGPIKCGWPEKIRSPSHDIARGVADAAAYALDAGIGGDTFP